VLSTGQLRKVQLAGCLLSPPKLLLLDEALDGLDAPSRREAMDAIAHATNEAAASLVMVAHRREDLPQEPTHALMLGLGAERTGWRAGEWQAMEKTVLHHLDEAEAVEVGSMTGDPHSAQDSAQGSAQDSASATLSGGARVQLLQRARTPPPLPQPGSSPLAAGAQPSALVEFDDVSIRYDCGSRCYVPPLRWTVREGENWAVVGGNGTGKTTLVDLISGDNVLGYRQAIKLFGRAKGSGESVWDIKRHLGVISTGTHMEYVDHAEAVARGVARSSKQVSTWEVVCSGFFDTVGLYAEPNAAQLATAKLWVDCLGLGDLVVPPRTQPSHSTRGASSGYAAATARARALLGERGAHGGAPGEAASARNFCALSFGQQKLVLLCRAMVKRPRLLLLDEPTHGLSADNRVRLLSMLATLAADPSVSIVLVTHRQDEIDALGLEHVLNLNDHA